MLAGLLFAGACLAQLPTTPPISAPGGGGGSGGGGTTLSVAAYTTSVTAQTAVSISAATHGQGSAAIAACFSNATPPLAVACSYTRDSSGNLAFSFDPAFSGTIEVFTGNIEVSTGGPSPILATTVTLQPSDITVLDTVPFTLVPICGASCVVSPHFMDVEYEFGTTDYTISSSNNFLLRINDLVSDSVTPVNKVVAYGGSVMALSVDPDINPLGFAAPPSEVAGFPVQLSADSPELRSGTPIAATVDFGGTGGYANGDTGTFMCLNNNVGSYTVTDSSGGIVSAVSIADGIDCLPGVVSTTPTGVVNSAAVAAGGAGYANGDTGLISCISAGRGSGSATYTVTASDGGAVTAVSVAGGAGYSPSSGCVTTTATGAGDGNLILDITGTDGDGSLALNITGVTGVGDGHFRITTYYTTIQIP